jgi:hypothetical protein
VSQAATVRVHTKKYLCALKWGGRFRYGGRRLVGSSGTVMFPPGAPAVVFDAMIWIDYGRMEEI